MNRLTTMEQKLWDEARALVAGPTMIGLLKLAGNMGKLQPPSLIIAETKPTAYAAVAVPLQAVPHDLDALRLMREGILGLATGPTGIRASAVILQEHLWAVLDPARVEPARKAMEEGEQRVSHLRGAKEIIRLTFVGRMDTVQCFSRVHRDGVNVWLGPWENLPAHDYVTGELIPNREFVRTFSGLTVSPLS